MKSEKNPENRRSVAGVLLSYFRILFFGDVRLSGQSASPAPAAPAPAATPVAGGDSIGHSSHIFVPTYCT